MNGYTGFRICFRGRVSVGYKLTLTAIINRDSVDVLFVAV